MSRFPLMNIPICDTDRLAIPVSRSYLFTSKKKKGSKYRACLYLSLVQWRGAIDRRGSRWGLTELLGRKLIEGDWGGL